ncbi:hypothetical protein [Caldicellulosiruptor morganii]|uniref:Uncharacterized protein n=1 Tax=Caldicellulosiruptor morganii TaxID=1387555 RepID=A0ABY7BLV2_9FIRM|nr:hypothetical protein [Caldicellulosiruptor morganii]WAM33554.1 hypothetical protein OTK00_002063 [Caldicellulosiruptor morganii]
MSFDEKEFEKVKNELIKHKRIVDVIPIKVEKMIEDWFLDDIQGIYKYLNKNFKGPFKVPEGKNGFDKISKLFKNFKRVYTKGEDTCKNLAKHLDVHKIIEKRLESLQKLIQILGCENKFKN